MHSEFQIPACLLADDATSADQAALSVWETLGRKVITTDAASFVRRAAPLEDGCVWVINTGTRAVSEEEARARDQRLGSSIPPGEGSLPLLQIDSRLRGLGKALKGLYETLDFDFLLFVPAEPELGRLARNGLYYHVEEGRQVLFHQSTLANSTERRFPNSDLRALVAGELGISEEHVFSLGSDVMSQGADAIDRFIRDLKRPGKLVVIPDVTAPEHFDAIIAAKQRLTHPDPWNLGPTASIPSPALKGTLSPSDGEREGVRGPASIPGSTPAHACASGVQRLRQRRILVAGSRTFLRRYLESLAPDRQAPPATAALAQAIDRQRRGAPLAVVCSLEPSMTSQLEYAQRSIGPNLVTVVFDASVLSADDPRIGREIEGVQRLVLQHLKAGRPVLLHTARVAAAPDAAVQQRLVEAIGRVAADDELLRHVTALFISGGQTAEALRHALRIPALEIRGAFAANVPWGMPAGGPLAHVPMVTKGGRLGSEAVLFEFFEQAHPLPRANVLPVITPLTSGKEIDEAGIERLIHYLVGLGTTDIFAVGNAGEFRFLRNEQRLEALEIFARKARGRLRVFAGVTGESAEETRRNYEAASRLGVFAAVIMPLYFLKRSEEIAPFVESLGSNQPALPLILYNNPERTGGQNISYEAVEALRFPVVAIKDSSGDLARFDRYVSALPVYEGQQRQFLEGHLHGARGTIGIIGHASSLPNEFYAPATTPSRREAIARAINDLSKTVKQGGAEVAAYKFLLSLMGVTGDTVASNEPARELTADQRELIRRNNALLISEGRALNGRPSPTVPLPHK